MEEQIMEIKEKYQIIFKLCEKIGIKTLRELRAFVENNMQSGEDLLSALQKVVSE